MTNALRRTPSLYSSTTSPTRYGEDDTTYVRAGLFLSGPGLVADWGCGTTYAKRYIGAPYIGIDGIWSQFADVQADLATYDVTTPKILMRHVLEHNWDWRPILHNMLDHFSDRAVLVLFLKPGDKDNKVSHAGDPDWPGLSLDEKDLTSILASPMHNLTFNYEDLVTQTSPQNFERIYFLVKNSYAP
jgi:hypothetical protein